MKALVVGATGLLGPEICRRLTAAGHQVRALVRPTSDTGKRTALTALGVELAEGDLTNPASLPRACGGVHAVISTASSTHSHGGGNSIESVDHHGQLALVDAQQGPRSAQLWRGYHAAAASSSCNMISDA